MKTKLLIAALMFALGLALGYVLTKKPKQSEVTQTTSDTQTTKDQSTTTTTIKKPDGTVITKKKTDITTKTEKKVDTVKTIVPTKDTYRVYGMVAFEFNESYKRIYGVMVTTPVISNLEVGAFSLTNGTFGGTLGWSF